MACRSLENGAVLFEERLVVRGYGNCVGCLVLVGETDVVVDVVALLVSILDLCESLLKEGAVLGRYGEYEIYAAVVVAHIFCSLHEVLCECGALFVRVGVEFEYSLRLGAVTQARSAEQGVGSLYRIVRGSAEDSLVVECKFFKIVGKCTDGLRFVGEYILEHTGCCS